jgi:hypothetical protein
LVVREADGGEEGAAELIAADLSFGDAVEFGVHARAIDVADDVAAVLGFREEDDSHASLEGDGVGLSDGDIADKRSDGALDAEDAGLAEGRDDHGTGHAENDDDDEDFDKGVCTRAGVMG